MSEVIVPIMDDFPFWDKIFYNVPVDGKCLFWGVFLSLKNNTNILEDYGINNFIDFMKLLDTVIDNSNNKEAYSLNNLVWGENDNIFDMVNLFGIQISITYIYDNEITTALFKNNYNGHRIDLLLYKNHYYLVINPENHEKIQKDLKNSISIIMRENLMNLGDTYDKYNKLIRRIEGEETPLTFYDIINKSKESKSSASGAAGESIENDRLIASIMQDELNKSNGLDTSRDYEYAKSLEKEYYKKYLKYKNKYLKLKNELN